MVMVAGREATEKRFIFPLMRGRALHTRRRRIVPAAMKRESLCRINDVCQYYYIINGFSGLVELIIYCMNGH